MLLDTYSTIFSEASHISHFSIAETLGRMKSPSSYDQVAVTEHPSNWKLEDKD